MHEVRVRRQRIDFESLTNMVQISLKMVAKYYHWYRCNFFEKALISMFLF